MRWWPQPSDSSSPAPHLLSCSRLGRNRPTALGCPRNWAVEHLDHHTGGVLGPRPGEPLFVPRRVGDRRGGPSSSSRLTAVEAFSRSTWKSTVRASITPVSSTQVWRLCARPRPSSDDRDASWFRRPAVGTCSIFRISASRRSARLSRSCTSTRRNCRRPMESFALRLSCEREAHSETPCGARESTSTTRHDLDFYNVEDAGCRRGFASSGSSHEDLVTIGRGVANGPRSRAVPDVHRKFPNQSKSTKVGSDSAAASIGHK